MFYSYKTSISLIYVAPTPSVQKSSFDTNHATCVKLVTESEQTLVITSKSEMVRWMRGLKSNRRSCEQSSL